MTESKYKKKLRRINLRNYERQQKEDLRAAKGKKKLETSKALAVYLVVLLNVIVIFAMAAMWHFADLTYLGVLISDIAAQVIVYAIYCVKAYKGKSAEENIKFEREKFFSEVVEIDPQQEEVNGL